MELFVCWAVYPLLLAVVAQGCGALVALAAGRPLTATVRLPCGIALAMAVLDVCTYATATARLAVWLVAALTIAGLVVSRPRPQRPSGALGAALVAFAAYAAPIVLSGTATWAGYIKLDDTSGWLALVDRALTHGHSIAGLPPSSYLLTLKSYLVVGYPLGSFLPLGIGHVFLGQDIAWLSDPWMAFMAAMLALALHRVATVALPRSPGWQRAVIAAVAAQPALLYAYYLWGGMKEMAGAMLVAAFAVTAPLALSGERRLRALVPVAVVVWAVVASLSAGGLVWLGPGLVVAAALAALVSRHELPRLPARPLAIGAALLSALAGIGAFLVFRPGGFAEHFQGVLTSGGQLGNLAKPLSIQQLAGIWPTADFRFTPNELAVTQVLEAIAAIGAAIGFVLAVARRRDELALLLACLITGAVAVDAIASPWVGAKGLADGSVAIPLAALVAAGWLLARPPSPRRRGLALRIAGVALGVAVAGGVVWSNLLGYHGVSLAPRQLMSELSYIGGRIAGQGPTLMDEFSSYGDRHFLRDAAPESASDTRTRPDFLITGHTVPNGGSANINDFVLDSVLAYRTLVLQRSPTASRPPSPYRLTYQDRFWQVWQRPLRIEPRVLYHESLNTALQPGLVPRCAAIVSLAHLRGVRELVAAPVPSSIFAAATAGAHPSQWTLDGGYLFLNGAGTATIPVSVPSAGRYMVWLGGSIRGPVTLYVDGHDVGEVRNELQEPLQYVPFGVVALRPGSHTVKLSYGGGDWLPGSGGDPVIVGPLALTHDEPQQPLLYAAPSNARSLCGRNLSWVEGLAGRVA